MLKNRSRYSPFFLTHFLSWRAGLSAIPLPLHSSALSLPYRNPVAGADPKLLSCWIYFIICAGYSPQIPKRVRNDSTQRIFWSAPIPSLGLSVKLIMTVRPNAFGVATIPCAEMEILPWFTQKTFGKHSPKIWRRKKARRGCPISLPPGFIQNLLPPSFLAWPGISPVREMLNSVASNHVQHDGIQWMLK